MLNLFCLFIKVLYDIRFMNFLWNNIYNYCFFGDDLIKKKIINCVFDVFS